MLKLYDGEKARRIIGKEGERIESLSRRYSLPAACLRAILWQELTEIDVFDLLADWAVRAYWARYGLRRRLRELGLVRSAEPLLRRGALGKRDSSTGYGQIFAYVAINAINFALDRGLAEAERLGIPGDRRLRPDNPDDLREIWLRLRGDRAFNLECVALNLLSAAEEMTGRLDFESFTPEEMALVFTRYNANVKHITDYGRAAYRRYLSYSGGASPDGSDTK